MTPAHMLQILGVLLALAVIVAMWRCLAVALTPEGVIGDDCAGAEWGNEVPHDKGAMQHE